MLLKKLLFIYNSNAGKGYIKNKLSDIIEVFVKADYEVTIYSTRYQGNAREIVKDIGSEYDLIVCSGGDGTLNEIADGLMILNKRPAVGYIPSGTTNDFAQSLGISKNMMKAVNTIMEGIEFPYDIGSLNDDYYTYAAVFGAFSEVSYETPQSSKNVFGKVAYVLEGVKRLPSLKSFNLKIFYDDQEFEDDFIFGMITNSKSIAGFKGLSGKNVLLDDGLFEVVLIKMPQNPIELQAIVTSLIMREANEKYIYSFHTNKIRIISSESIPWSIDGEFGGEYSDVIIQNHKQAISFIRDKEKEKIKEEIKNIEAAIVN